MRTVTVSDWYSNLETNVKANLKEVIKISRDYGGNIDNASTTDSLWIPSYGEMGGDTQYYEQDGVQYSSKFSTNESRIKTNSANATPSYWLRTASGTSDFATVSGGGFGGNSANKSLGVVLGFCT